MPEVASGDNKELRLNGMGLRKEKALFKVYVVALYLEQPTTDAQAAIATDEEKRIVISIAARPQSRAVCSGRGRGRHA
jgi:hypothetical protein